VAGIIRLAGRVSISKYVKLKTGWRYCPVHVSKNGRIKPDYVLVKKVSEYHPEGFYSLDWYDENKKRRRKKVGKVCAVAEMECEKKQRALQAAAAGVTVVNNDDNDDPTRLTLQQAKIKYFENLVSLGKDKKTIAAYRVSVVSFLESCKKRFVDEMDRQDLIDYIGWLRKQPRKARRGDPNRTYHNKVSNVVIFLKSFGKGKLLKAADYPSFAEKTVFYLTRQQITIFRNACDDEEERFTFEFFLKTGFRDTETAHSEYSDVHDGKIHVREKPQYNWHPKKWQTRTVPIPKSLIDSIAERKKSSRTKLIFPNLDGGPNLHLLRVIQRIAKRTNIEIPVDLHTIRRTFGTLCEKEFSIQDAQRKLGHKDVATTIRYLGLSGDDSEQTRDAVNTMFDFDE
jgi:integrase